MKKLLIIAALLASFGTSAKSSNEEVYLQAGDGGIISTKVVQRVMIFGSERNWLSEDGHILVCPYSMIARTFENNVCFAKDDKDTRGRWMKMEDLKLPGFEQIGFEYRMHGSYGQRLFVYFGKPQPKPVATPVLPATNNITLKVENLTIDTKTVRIQRKKK